MITLELDIPILPHNDEVVTGTRYQVSKKSDFSTILHDTGVIRNQLEFYSTQIDIELSPTIKYYIRASYETDKAGMEGWGDILEFTATNVIEDTVKLSPPKVVNTPKINILYVGDKYTPLSGIVFNLAPDESDDSDIVRADFSIEDIYGNTMTNMNITKDFRRFRFNFWLMPNMVYIARASVTNKSGSVSNFGSVPFSTETNQTSYKITKFDKVATGGVIEITTSGIYGTVIEVHSRYGIISQVNLAKGITTHNINDSEFENASFVRMATIKDGEIQPWTYKYKMTQECSLPLPFPVELGCK